MKTRFIAIILGLTTLLLCACGAKEADHTFTVDYVAMAGVAKPIILIVRQHQNKTTKMDAGSFKGCALVNAEYAAGDSAVLSGTEDGYLKVEGGMILTLKDSEGAEHTVEVKEGSTFTLDTSVDGAWRILLPE